MASPSVFRFPPPPGASPSRFSGNTLPALRDMSRGLPADNRDFIKILEIFDEFCSDLNDKIEFTPKLLSSINPFAKQKNTNAQMIAVSGLKQNLTKCKLLKLIDMRGRLPNYSRIKETILNNIKEELKGVSGCNIALSPKTLDKNCEFIKDFLMVIGVFERSIKNDNIPGRLLDIMKKERYEQVFELYKNIKRTRANGKLYCETDHTDATEYAAQVMASAALNERERLYELGKRFPKPPSGGLSGGNRRRTRRRIHRKKRMYSRKH